MSTQPQEGITTNLDRFIQAINRVIAYYEPCDPFDGSNPAEHDFLLNLDQEKVKPWLQPSQNYPNDDIYSQFESQYLYLTLKGQQLVVFNNGSSLHFQEDTSIFDLLFRAYIGFNMKRHLLGVCQVGYAPILQFVYADDLDENKKILREYFKEFPIDTPQDQLFRQIDF